MQQLNPNAQLLQNPLPVNASAAQSLASVLSSNLGPKGTLKLLVSGAGALKLTKDGSVLLGDMTITHPTALMIARSAAAQEEVCGDGTSSVVLYVGEIMRQCMVHIEEGIHPSLLADGIEKGIELSLQYLSEHKIRIENDILTQLVKTVIGTKLSAQLVNHLSKDIVEAVEISRNNPTIQGIDLHMVELMHMRHKTDLDTRLIRGLVLDHGPRHPDMPKSLKNCFILTLNVSLEYEKTEINSGFFYSTPEQREKLVESERAFVDEKIRKIIALKQSVCTKGEGFVIINQKGIDPMSLDLLQKQNIFALRRAKRRNMERLQLICGGVAQNSVDALTRDVLGYAGTVYEETLGEDKYTFIEDVKHPHACTILIKGSNDYTIAQVKDAIKDGLRTVKTALEDGCVLPGAGSIQIGLYHHLKQQKVTGPKRYGVEAFASGLLTIPKTLIRNAGLDVPTTLSNVLDANVEGGKLIGVNLNTGKTLDPTVEGVWDGYRVLRHGLNSSGLIAMNLLLVDQIMRAGRTSLKDNTGGGAPGGVIAIASYVVQVVVFKRDGCILDLRMLVLMVIAIYGMFGKRKEFRTVCKITEVRQPEYFTLKIVQLTSDNAIIKKIITRNEEKLNLRFEVAKTSGKYYLTMAAVNKRGNIKSRSFELKEDVKNAMRLKKNAEMTWISDDYKDFEIECGNVERTYSAPQQFKVTCTDQAGTGLRTIFSHTLELDMPANFDLGNGAESVVELKNVDGTFGIESKINVEGAEVATDKSTGRFDWNVFKLDSPIRLGYVSAVSKLWKCKTYIPGDAFPDKYLHLNVRINGISNLVQVPSTEQTFKIFKDSSKAQLWVSKTADGYSLHLSYYKTKSWELQSDGTVLRLAKDLKNVINRDSDFVDLFNV